MTRTRNNRKIQVLSSMTPFSRKRKRFKTIFQAKVCISINHSLGFGVIHEQVNFHTFLRYIIFIRISRHETGMSHLNNYCLHYIYALPKISLEKQDKLMRELWPVPIKIKCCNFLKLRNFFISLNNFYYDCIDNTPNMRYICAVL